MPLTIRSATAADADHIAAIYAPYVRDTAISFELVPPTVEQMRARIDALTATYPWLVCADGSTVVGYAYAGRFRERPAYQWSVETTVYVRGDAHRRGIGRALYGALLPIVAAQEFCTAYAVITVPSASSVGLHESLGFQPVGVCRGVGYKFDAWRDVGTWELPLRPRPSAPSPPRPIGAVCGTPQWDAAIAAGQALLGR
jgi:L-amino acid N-acyltransferase YncA